MLKYLSESFQLILTGRFFIAVSNFLPSGPFGNGNIINQSNLAQCLPFQKNITVVRTNDQVNYSYTVIY